jgi:hypothetical protein
MEKGAWSIVLRVVLGLSALAMTPVDVAVATELASRTLPHAEKCAVDLPEGLKATPSEQYAWQRICMGGEARMSQAPNGDWDGQPCRIADIVGNVPANRQLRSEFLQLILTQEPWLSAPKRPQVRVNCGLINGELDFGNLYVIPEFGFANGKIDGAVNWNGVRFSRSVSLEGSNITAKFQGSALVIDGHLLMKNGAKFADIDLISAKINGNMELDRSTVVGILNADRIKVGGSLFLRGGGEYEDIILIAAQIGNHLQLAGSTFKGSINLTGASVENELVISSVIHGSSVWEVDAHMVLRNTRVNALQAQPVGWRRSNVGSDWLPTDLTGFTYKYLSGAADTDGDSMADAPVNWLIGWIEAQEGHGTHYDPQPFTQLAYALKQAGAVEKAKAITYAKFEHKRKHDAQMGAMQRWQLEAERWLVGYGVYPFRVLWWFGGLVVIGTLLALRSRTVAVRRWPFWCSLENALPLIEMNFAFRNARHRRWGLATFFHMQKVLGFILATILVGALTFLGK